jgi:1-acyl-sn-glycerol-3-phosphate acyltransferase
MREWVLKVYDFLSRRRKLAALLLFAVLGLSALSALRLSYDEDINAFLPSDPQTEQYRSVYERMGATDRIAVFFSAKEGSDCTVPDLQDAMAAFGDSLAARGDWEAQICLDDASGVQLRQFIAANAPYFLREDDYRRADSLLAQPGYLQQRLSEVKEAFYSPFASVSRDVYRSDPLGLFTPVWQRLSVFNPAGEGASLRDGFLFTADGSTGIAFLRSPYGGSESGANAALVASMKSAEQAVEAQFPAVEITSTGAPEVAVENATRIRKDSLLALGIAIVLICLVLFLSFRRLADVLWIVISIVCGTLFSLGLIALFRPSVSIIILGIGSMIIGIAVNYPLHYVDHLKYRPDKRQALADQIEPLLVGNITTVGAFLSLMLLSAGALRDFGFIGAAMLLGTILFVLFFLPVFFPMAKKPRRTLRLDLDRHIRLPRPASAVVFLLFVALTAFFYSRSGDVVFDADAHHINYMSTEQAEGFARLEALGGPRQPLYAVSASADVQQALEGSERVAELLGEKVPGYAGISDFVPSKRAQEQRLVRWNRFRSAHPELPLALNEAASASGFSQTAFAPFLSLWSKDYRLQEVDFFAPFTTGAGASRFLSGPEGVYVVNTPESAPGLKEELRASLPQGSFCFEASDLSSRLVGLLSADFDKIGLLCSLIVFLFLTLSLGRLELSLLSFLPLAVGWIWILGFMQVSGLYFNIVNIILATFIFGQGDDYTIFITEGLMYEYATGRKILHSYKNCVVLSALIMFIGIGALIFAKHPAMRSLSLVTMIGMVTVVGMAYYLPPLLFRFLTQKRGELREVPLTFRRIGATAVMMLNFLLSLLGIALVTFVWVLFPRSEKWNLRYHRFVQRCAQISFKLIPDTRLSVRNPRGEDFSRPAVVVCNHQSHFDVLAALCLTPRLVVLTNDWVRRNPLYAPVIHRGNFFPVSEGLEKNIECLRPLVEKGYSVLVFPEGTRSADGSIQRFHRGFSALARTLDVDVLPLYIHGFHELLPKKATVLRRAGLTLEIGERIRPEAFPESDKDFASELRKHYAAAMERMRDACETPAFVAPFVKYRYLYKGSAAMSECRRTLRREMQRCASPEWEGLSSVRVMNGGYGAFALLLALSHRHLRVICYERDEEKYLTASHLTALPSNLEYVWLQDGVVPAEADQEIVL